MGEGEPAQLTVYVRARFRPVSNSGRPVANCDEPSTEPGHPHLPLNQRGVPAPVRFTLSLCRANEMAEPKHPGRPLSSSHRINQT